MSGAEPAAVLGMISSIIAVIEASQKIYEAAKNAQGLHEAFRKVAENVPLVLNTLREAKKVQKKADAEYKTTIDGARRQAIEESSRAVVPIMETCKGNAQALKEIFEKVVPGDGASSFERYAKAVQTVMPGKKRKVEELMKDILEKLQLLHDYYFFKTVVTAADLNAAIEQLSMIPPSLPDDETSHYAHTVSASLNVNPGSGTMHTYTQSGGSGKMFTSGGGPMYFNGTD